MIQKLFNHILATCLLFGSLYLPAYAATANKTPGTKPASVLKKPPETNYLEGDTCLEQGKIACARLALAGIPATSVYAKLLQGSIALREKQTDKALLLLLPLQTEADLIPQAKTRLHLQLAAAFEILEDTAQAMLHLMQAETVMTASDLKDRSAGVNSIHEKIWGLLSKLQQTELVELRGNHTDNTFQGWIDLRLAAKNQNPESTIAGWSALYPDHPAQAFAKNLASASAEAADTQSALASAGSIALIMPLSDETYSAKADAFQQGLQTALAKQGLHNALKTYPTTEKPYDMDASRTLAQSEGNTYFVMLNFDMRKISDNRIAQPAANRTLHIGHTLDDEAQHISRFVLRSGMQHITIITIEDTGSKALAERFEAAWNKLTSLENSNSTITSITLPTNVSATDNRLLELKSQLNQKMPDMVVLAMQAPEARLVRPHIPISTPVMIFSIAHESSKDAASYPLLNTARVFEMPYLLEADQASEQDNLSRDNETQDNLIQDNETKDYQTQGNETKGNETKASTLNSNELKRWFALGADGLQLLIASENMNEREITISGLSGTLTILPSGLIKRELPLAIVTESGITPE